MARCDVLVTGARGFVGGHVLARAVHAGLSAIAADGDLRDVSVADAAVGAARPRAVLHLAATRRGDRAWAALSDDLAMAGAVIDAVARHAPEAPVLIPGSAAQYGMGNARPLTEGDDTSVPVSAYGVMKSVIEHAVSADPLRRSVRVIIARSFNHIGPGQGAGAPAAQWAREIVAAEAAGGGIVRVGDLAVVRDFLDVRDVVDAYIALVRSTANGVVNVCSGVPTPLRRVLDLLVGSSKVPIAVEHDPGLSRAVDPPSVVGDPARLRHLTDWSPAISLEQSVADLLADLRCGAATVAPDMQAVGS